MPDKKLGLYIHIPFCMKKCLYCDFCSGVYGPEIRKDYVKALTNELRYQSERLYDYSVASIYIGGGTPTWLEEKLMDRVIKTVFKYYNVEPAAEVTMEMNPATASESQLFSYHTLGVNRLSIGLQSSNEEELRTLGRVHSFKDFLRSFEAARRSGFDNISVDIMTGIPGQNPLSLKKTLSDVFLMKPEHISCYSLIIEEGTPFHDMYGEDDEKRKRGEVQEFLPSEDEEYELGKTAQNMIKAAGFSQYEISNYAKLGKTCLHNVGYWKRTPYLGVGISAASLIDEIRYTNTRDINEYIRKGISSNFPLYNEAEALSEKKRMEEFMFLGLRMTEGILENDFYETFGVLLDSVYMLPVERLLSEKLLKRDRGRLFLTELGADLSNYALSMFLLDKD